MKWFILFFGLLLLTNIALAEEEDYVPGQAIINFEPGIIVLPEGGGKASIDSVTINSSAVAAMCDSCSVTSFEKVFPDAEEGGDPDLSQYYLIEFGYGDEFISVTETVERFQTLSEVISAEPNAICQPDSVIIDDLEPNDPYYQDGSQWGLNDPVTGIDAPGGWGLADEYGTLGEGIIIAIIDGGVDRGHDDLDGHIVGGEAGYFTSHGTQCAGVAGAETNNDLGIAGMGWHAKIMPFNAPHYWLNELVADIKAAADAGAHIISMSWTFYDRLNPSNDFPVLKDACQYAYNDTMILVTSSGNERAGWPFPYNGFPQAYEGDLVISVGATAKEPYGVPPFEDDPKRTSWSNYCPEGETWLDVVAPGEDILTTIPNNGYGYSSGTSFSCPLTAGVIVLMCSKHIGYRLPPSEAWEVIRETARDIEHTGLEWDRFTGKGIIDAKAAFEHTWVGVEESEAGYDPKPKAFCLSQNYPNPFNPVTQIKYALPRNCWVRLEVYNILGQKVTTLVDGEQKVGYKAVRWDASRMASGIYIYRIQAGDFVQTRRMILLK